MPRKFMYDAVMSLPAATAEYGSRVFSTGAADEGPDNVPDKPFVIIRASTSQPPLFMPKGIGTKQSRVQVWVHDAPGDTTNIDKLVRQLEDTVPGMAPAVTAEGRFTDVKWEETSPDGFDDHYQTTTRYVTFLVTWRPAVQA